MTIAVYVFAIIVIALLIYFFLVRPWQLTWGTTKEEAASPLAGDEIVKTTHFVATRAVTINAAPTRVWKWILQLGSARAGWYSIDWIDNGGKPSSREILRIPKDRKRLLHPIHARSKERHGGQGIQGA